LEFRNQPEKADMIWDFLQDPDKFIEKNSQKKVNENNYDTFERIKLQKQGKKQGKQPSQQKDTEQKDVITIPENK